MAVLAQSQVAQLKAQLAQAELQRDEAIANRKKKPTGAAKKRRVRAEAAKSPKQRKLVAKKPSPQRWVSRGV